ncbi:MAG TPA: hypothetical protein DD727_04350 [Clostridiales bacterium]|nr:hypothetical protein [Clostridiales bacterium]
MRKNTIILLGMLGVLALLVGVEAALLRAASGASRSVKVFCAARDIALGSVISADMLTIRLLPQEAAEGAVLPGDSYGAEYYAGYRVACALHAGEIIYTGNLLPSHRFPAGFIQTEGNVLMALELKGEQANGWWLGSGGTVDLLLVSNTEKRVTSRLEGIRIVSLLDESGKVLPSGGEEHGLALPRYLSLEVTPEQAVILAGAKTNGKVELAVRADRE